MNREHSTYLPDGPAIRGATDTLYSSEKIISLDISLEGREKLPKSIHTVVFDLDGTYIDNVKKFRTHFVVIAHQVFGVTRKEAALHFMANPHFIITARRFGFPAQDYEEEFKPGIVAVTDTPGDVLLFKAAGVSVFAIADYATTRVKMLRALSEFPISQYDQVASSLEHLRGHIERINFKAAVGDKTEVV